MKPASTLIRLATLIAACAIAMVWSACTHTSSAAQIGQVPSAGEIDAWNIDVSPNGDGLPAGSGTAATGEGIYAAKCVACHGVAGNTDLAGGIGSLRGPNPVRSVGSYWPYATTLFDYIRRAMPADKPQTLSAGEIYSLSAYVLWMNGVVSRDQILDRTSLPRVGMPNRKGFVERDPRPDVP
jgi:S-disulfanyl-L-cysteine oxidoreductase SoxD